MAHDDVRQDMVDQVRDEQQKRQRAPRVHKMPKAAPVDGTNESAPSPPVADHSESNSEFGDAPKKRRRRRRSTGPKAAGEAAPDSGV